MAVLEVNDLRTSFRTDDGTVQAVDGVSFSVERGKTLGLVGESGCGKSVTCLTIMGLNDRGSSASSGEALFKGEDLLQLPQRRLRELRGNEVAMIFQDPMTSLNPVHSIGKQLVEAVLLHRDVTRRDARRRALELLQAVGIPRAERRLDDYPHQFSGGMRQRVMIAMALIDEPDLLIADEPTTALDVTTQAQILELMASLQRDLDTAILMITHDLGVVAEIADRVIVMYGGRVVEVGTVEQIFYEPKHPYTWGLLGSVTRIDRPRAERLAQIDGQPPSLVSPPQGCHFRPRCRFEFEKCPQVPALEQRRAEMHVVEMQRVVFDRQVHALHAAMLAGLPRQVVLLMMADRKAAQDDVAEERGAEMARWRHHPAHAERRAELGGLPRFLRAGADHFLEGNDVGIDAGQHAGDSFEPRAAVEAAPAMNVIGRNAHGARSPGLVSHTVSVSSVPAAP